MNFVNLFFLLFGLITSPLFSQEEEKGHSFWQYGLGSFFFHAPHYRGSDQERLIWFPFPGIVYRSDRVDVENSFMHLYFFRSRKLSFNLGLMGQLPVSSSENRARRGMPALNPAIEIGPMVNYNFYRSTFLDLTFSLPIRTVWALDFWQAQYIGIFSVPYLALTFFPQPWNLFTSMQLSLAPMFATKEFHQYYYGVKPQFSLPERRSYTAHGGGSGQQYSLLITKRWPKATIFGLFRYDRLQEAVFHDSPLVRRHDYFATGLGLIYYFATSEAN